MNIQEVKNIRIADYLQSLGYTPVKQQGNNLWYESPFREEKDASFKVTPSLTSGTISDSEKAAISLLWQRNYTQPTMYLICSTR